MKALNGSVHVIYGPPIFLPTDESTQFNHYGIFLWNDIAFVGHEVSIPMTQAQIKSPSINHKVKSKYWIKIEDLPCGRNGWGWAERRQGGQEEGWEEELWVECKMNK